jgi:methyl-accepting chemotaxis protein
MYIEIFLFISLITSVIFSVKYFRENKKIKKELKNNITSSKETETDKRIEHLAEVIIPLEKKILVTREIIPVVTEQIKSATERIEDSTVNVIERFNTITENISASIYRTDVVISEIKKKLASGTDGYSGNGKYTADYIKKRYEEMLQGVVAELAAILEHQADYTKKLDKIMEQVESIMPFSEDIAEIADMSKLLALNANIEAARAGNYGKAFGVVADEVKILANNSSVSANKIKSRLEIVHRFIGETNNSIKEAIHVEKSYINSTIALLKGFFQSMIISSAELINIMDSSLGETSNIKEEIETIIFSLQFEDITKQMSGHVIDALNSIREDFSSLEGMDNIEKDLILLGLKEDIFKHLQGLYTMEQERKTAKKTLQIKEEKEAEKEEKDNNVTFF